MPCIFCTSSERSDSGAKNIALHARKLCSEGRPALPRHSEIEHMSRIALEILRKVIAALDAMQTEGAADLVRRDSDLDGAYQAILRRLISFMIEDPRTISSCLDIVFVARALERIGDHAKNIAEYVVYVIKGRDVRHVSIAEIEHAVRTRTTESPKGRPLD